MRKSCTRMVYVDVSAALADGVPFFVSSNGVVLTPGVGAVRSAEDKGLTQTGELPLRYVSRVTDRNGAVVWPCA